MRKEEISRNLAIARQTAAIATAVYLPLSTAAQTIAASIFILLAIATAEVQRFVVMRSPAAWLPVTLFKPALLGVTRSSEPLSVVLEWVGPYAKLLLIPIVIMTALRSRYSAPLLLLTQNCEPHRCGSKRIEGPAR
jgi:O-antigen ligase